MNFNQRNDFEKDDNKMCKNQRLCCNFPPEIHWDDDNKCDKSDDCQKVCFVICNECRFDGHNKCNRWENNDHDKNDYHDNKNDKDNKCDCHKNDRDDKCDKDKKDDKCDFDKKPQRRRCCCGFFNIFRC